MVEITGFAVGDEIGRGGFGVVYRARELAFERDVAVKVLHDVPGTDLRQRFLTECRAVGLLDGRPGIPTVYSTGVTADGAPFMAMELLPGGSLSDRQPLPADVVIRVGRRLTEALQAAHEGGVIHRDVKPANVLFDVDDQPSSSTSASRRWSARPRTARRPTWPSRWPSRRPRCWRVGGRRCPATSTPSAPRCSAR